MRLPLTRAFVTIAFALAGCGYVGNPLPPAVNIPLPVKEVKAAQVGDRVIVEFTQPVETTESLEIKRLGSVDLRVGKKEDPFTTEKWAETAKPAETKLSDSGTVKRELPVTDWVGQDIVIGVRTTNLKGRPSAWNFASLHVAPAPAVPTDLRAVSDPKGARLAWQGSSPAYRVFRRLPDEKEGVQIGEPTEASFLDDKAEFDKKYVYWVVAVDGGARSTESAVIEFTAKDEFAPATPTGLTVIVGPSSIELAWESNTEPDLRGYKIYRSIAGGEPQLLADLVDVPAFSDKKPEAGKKHSYSITAIDKRGNESAKTEAVSVDVP